MREEIIKDLNKLNIDNVKINELINKISNENNNEMLMELYEKLLQELITASIKIQEKENYYILEKILIKLAKLQINNKNNQDTINFLNKLFNADEDFLKQDKNENTILHTAILLQVSSNIFEFIFLAYEPWENDNNMDNKIKETENIKLKTEFLELLNTQNNDGNTALHLAINNKQYELAHRLINYGAQTNLKNNKQEQAFDLLVQYFFLDYLKRYLKKEYTNDVWTKLKKELINNPLPLLLKIIAAKSQDITKIQEFKDFSLLIETFNNKHFILNSLVLKIYEKQKHPNFKFLNKLFNPNGENFLEQDKNGNNTLHNAILLKLPTTIIDFILSKYEPWKIDNNMDEKTKSKRKLDNFILEIDFLELLNTQNNDGNTALHLAIDNKQYELATSLIVHGAKTNLKNKNEETNHFLSKLEEELKNNPSQFLPTIIAAKSQDITKIKEFKDFSFLIETFNNKHFILNSLVLKIYEKQKHPNFKFLNKLFNADEKNFLKQDENGNNTLHNAIILKLPTTIIDFILSAYEPWEIDNNMDEKPKTAINDFNDRLKTEFLKILNTQNNDGNTALHLAINNKQYELAHKLISYGAQTNLKNKKQEQPFVLLLKPVFKILLSKSTFEKNINAVDENGETSLMLTARYGFTEIAETLILLGADITKREKRYINDVYSWIKDSNYNSLKEFLFLYPLTKDIYTRSQLMTMIKGKNPEINKLLNDIKNNSLNNKGISYLQQVFDLELWEIAKDITIKPHELNDKKNKLLDYILKNKTDTWLDTLTSIFKYQYVFKHINYVELINKFDFIFPLIKRLEFKKAVNENDINTVQTLLKNKAQIDFIEYSQSPLFRAINEGNTDIVMLMLNHKNSNIIPDNIEKYNELTNTLIENNQENKETYKIIKDMLEIKFSENMREESNTLEEETNHNSSDSSLTQHY